MKKSYMLALVIVGSLAFTGFAKQPVLDILDGGKHLLRYNPKVGTSGKMVMDYNLNISMDMMGQSMAMDQIMEMGADMTVVENTKDVVKTKMNYDYMAMSMDNPMTGNMSYDSRKDNSGDAFGAELSKAFEPMLNEELNITQDKRGMTIESDLAEANGIQSNQGGLNFSSVMGMNVFPEEALSIGDSWTNVMNEPTSPMKFDVTMTLKNVKDGRIYIDFESTVLTNENFESEEEVEMEVSGKQSGSFVYEESTMWLIEGLIKQDLDMKVQQMGMEIPMKIIGEMMLTVE